MDQSQILTVKQTKINELDSIRKQFNNFIIEKVKFFFFGIQKVKIVN